MFTGLVEGMGQVVSISPSGPDAVLVVRPPWPLAQAVLGESVAVNGACLTVTSAKGPGCSLDVSAETLSHTTLGRLKPGARVNLERAMALGERLGGHLVTGHVDCVGRVAGLHTLGGSTRIFIHIPPEHLKLVVTKGSVAVDGISLTVNKVDAQGFELNIIPHTMAATTLSLAKEGDSVNIETDLIGKYVARLMNQDEGQRGSESGGQGGRGGAEDGPSGGLSRDKLSRLGF